MSNVTVPYAELFHQLAIYSTRFHPPLCWGFRCAQKSKDEDAQTTTLKSHPTSMIFSQYNL